MLCLSLRHIFLCLYPIDLGSQKNEALLKMEVVKPVNFEKQQIRHMVRKII